ncbi:NAD+ synthase [Pyruvatibacter mobilis]|uniref:Glutamine-dependent NAD(+) synthetase n=1 Tax=Pyruvatibacter mobilis TaxID=1712261 RepID=A0A845QBC9_9HYPH|nr:NAD+ synthase [Pyruvatibacter mobilis]NBG95460.1 NAD+ synthase [Pyruvatibacter mobilis]QJD75453.1 NAD+ synthase [Pyruvatibacter mobilis]GGD15767.1 NAD+ synthase [Pyruvatibacter mobilis]
MTDTLSICLAQLNPVVGNVEANIARARSARAEAAAKGADLIVFTELFVSGYPPEDLVLKPAFQDAARAVLEDFAADTADGGPAVLIGVPLRDAGLLHNSVALLEGGKVAEVRHKQMLPNYGVFDEMRVFAPGRNPDPIPFRGIKLGVPICEDIWHEHVVATLKARGADLLLVPNGSPFEATKHGARMDHVRARISESGLPLAYVNQVGGQDELVFDGASFVMNTDFTVPLSMPAFDEALVMTEWTRGEAGWTCAAGARAPDPEGLEAIYSACVLGLRDYVNKNRFPGVVLGLSGGIDSAICAAMAADALGPDKVRCVMLPSKYTSQESLDDAEACAKLIGTRLDTVAISETVDAIEGALAPLFEGHDPDITEENIQSRARGLLLMALSNKFGDMVVTTGNKSEVSVGYATLYGDMNGGFNPIKDLYKMQVFALCEWRNQNKPAIGLGPDGRVIPQRIIDKPPSAELREDQKDEDSLPPYPVLDDILEGLVEHEQSAEEIIARGHDRDVVKRIEHLLYIAEYKRRQAAPGVKIGRKYFGRDRRYPITNGFRDAR